MMKEKGLRMDRISKVKKESKKKGVKPSSIKKNVFEMKCEAFLRDLIRKRSPKNFCPHFLIGSSSFLQGSYSFSRAHGFLNTNPDARIVGLAGEIGFKKIAQNIMHIHPLGISSKNPWVASSADFIFKEGPILAAEIKTSGILKNVLAFTQKFLFSLSLKLGFNWKLLNSILVD